ncbi:MAG: SIS domain-containing protein, partial [Chloroflexota bacterium]
MTQPIEGRGSAATTSAVASGANENTALTWFGEADSLLRRIRDTQAEVMEEVAHVCADTIAADGLVHLFGSGHSRIPVEEMFPRY